MGSENGVNLTNVHNQLDNATSSNITPVELPSKKSDHIPSEANKSNTLDIENASAETETTQKVDPTKMNRRQYKPNMGTGRTKGREIVCVFGNAHGGIGGTTPC